MIFEGQFQEDKQHGRGVLRKPDGQVVEGIWDDGKLIDVIDMEQR